ncbi:MAG: glycosyltransferase [Bacteroidales bacterium]
MKKRALIITYYWPPSGGAGVQRWLKFVKYLPEFGWQPVVYTPENPEYPVLDDSLEKDVPAVTEIIKSRVWEPYDLYKKFVGLKKDERINAAFLSERRKPKLTEQLAVWLRGNLFIPDARRFWIRPSVKFLIDYLKQNPVDVIISSGPPHSMHLIAKALKEQLHLPWLADFRDPWTGIDFYQDLKLTPAADRKHKRLEKEVLKSADRVVVISEGMKQDFEQILPRNYDVITNGFDEEDMPSEQIVPDQKFSIAHIGTLAKSRNPVELWKALQELTAEDRDFNSALKIKLVGKVDFLVMESIRQHQLEPFLQIIPYLDHDKVIEEQRRSQVLLLLINNTPNSRMILTGKLFEYLSARRPILCIGPEDGDAARIIEETKAGKIAGFGNISEIKSIIREYFRKFKNGQLIAENKSINRFSRRALAEDLSEVLKQM